MAKVRETDRVVNINHYPKRRSMKPLAERFWAKVHKTDGCWLWTGGTHEFGYGVIGLGTRAEGTTKAHQVSWEIHFGPVPEGMFVLHECDNPPCVNPAHLFLGTSEDNAMDMKMKGRSTALLTSQQREEIVFLYIKGGNTKTYNSSGYLAEKYGVSQTTIFDVVSGRYGLGTRKRADYVQKRINQKFG